MKKIILILFIVLNSLFLFACEDANENILELALEQINIPSEVTNDLDLKTEIEVNGKIVKAKWHSLASAVISSDGVITVDVTDRTAKLALTLEYNGETLNKTFDIVVKGSTDLLVLYAVSKDQLKLPATITEDLDLKTKYVQGGYEVTAQWTSSNPAVISTSGKVTRMFTDQEVTLEVVLTLNKATRKETFTVTVLQAEDAMPVNYYHLAQVWMDAIANEAPDPAIPGCFPGAIYRKVVSSRDNWLGIEAVVTLGEFTPDEQRYDVTRASYYLDNASLYMGGNATYESDIGLTWSIGHTSATNKTLTQKGIAYRPFWRYITKMETGTRQNIYKNANVNDYEYYYYPGDKIRISVFSPKPDYLQMRIELLELTTIPKYVSRRASYNLGNDFNRVFTTDPFPSEGAGRVKTEFKRVNAIDQVNNESKPTINTNAKVENAIWHEVYLYRKINNNVYKVPMTESRSAGMICPLGKNVNGDFTNAIKINYNGVDKALGGEIVTLIPNNGTGKLYNAAIIVENPYEKYQW